MLTDTAVSQAMSPLSSPPLSIFDSPVPAGAVPMPLSTSETEDMDHYMADSAASDLMASRWASSALPETLVFQQSRRLRLW